MGTSTYTTPAVSSEDFLNAPLAETTWCITSTELVYNVGLPRSTGTIDIVSALYFW